MNINDEKKTALDEMTDCLKQLAPSVNQKFYYDSDIYPLLFRISSMHLKNKGLKSTLSYFDNVADAQRFFCKRLEEADMEMFEEDEKLGKENDRVDINTKGQKNDK